MTIATSGSFTSWADTVRTSEGMPEVVTATAVDQVNAHGSAVATTAAFTVTEEFFPRGVAMVFSWGAGEDGQLGLENGFRDEQALQLVPALADKQVVSVVAGSRNSLAISAAGQVYLWGWNQRSTLGHSFEEKKLARESQPCPALKGVRVEQAAVGGWHVLALSEGEGSTAFAWGGNEYGQCGKKPDRSQGSNYSYRDIRLPITCASHLRVRQVAAGGMHSLVLTDQGEVWTWGQPWPPANNKDGYMATRVQNLSNVALVKAGAFHNVALLETGEVFTWGDNEYGQLGTGSTQPCSTPQAIKQLQGLDVVDIEAGGWHTVALTLSGQVWAWGRGEHGRLGLGEDRASKLSPVPVTTLAHETVVQVACGGTHSVALTEDGRMFAFGRRDNGRLGPLGSVTTGHPVPVPLPGEPLPMDGAPEVSFPLRTAQVSCGGRHSLALVCRAEELEMHRRGLQWVAARAKQLEKSQGESAEPERQEDDGPEEEADASAEPST